MLPTTIRSPPSTGDYVSLADYQSQTPQSFTGGKPILYFHLPGAKATIPQAQRGSLAIFPRDASTTAGGEANGDGPTEEVVEATVDVFVNSETFTIFSQSAEAGVSIPYPSISIHAVKQVAAQSETSGNQAVWMQLEFSDGGADDDDFQTVELTILPQSPAAEANVTPTLASRLYEAIASCSNLHPDPNDGEDEDEDEYDPIVFEGSAEHEALEGFTGVLRGAADGGLPPPMPGSGGWITADNVNEYFDAEGNWIGQTPETEELGEGAGRIRVRDELEQDGTDGVNGDGQDNDPENKRARVD